MADGYPRRRGCQDALRHSAGHSVNEAPPQVRSRRLSQLIQTVIEAENDTTSLDGYVEYEPSVGRNDDAQPGVHKKSEFVEVTKTIVDRDIHDPVGRSDENIRNGQQH